MTAELQTFDDIRALYPDEWVIIGDPQLRDPDLEASVVSRLEAGIVLFHSKDRRELVEKGREFRKGCRTYTTVFTGEIPKGRKFWL